MFCHVLIGVLFYTVLICKEPFCTAERKPSLVDQMNAALSYPRWERITDVAAKYRFPVNGNESFTGKDVFVSDNSFVDNENSAMKTFIGENDESVKHYMVTHLVACVYANAALKFANLLRNILEEGNRARKNVRSLKNYYRKRKNLDDAEEEEASVVEPLERCEDNSNSSDGRPSDEECLDYKLSWTIFNFAVLQLTNSGQMFDRMFSTMRYLIDTSPSAEYIRETLEIPVVSCLRLFKDVSKDISLVLPTYYGEMDPDYNNKVCALSYRLKGFIVGQAKASLQPFLKNHCKITEKDSPSFKTLIVLFKRENKKKPTSTDIALQFGVRIQQLVHEVCNNYYSELGFEYNDRDETTSFPSPPTL